MQNRIRIDHAVAIGPQPTESDLQELLDEGFRTVVNLRSDGEEDQPLSPRDEGVQARNLGLEYVSIAVPPDQMESQYVDNFRGKLPYLPTPIYIHCAAGKRAAAFVVIEKALAEGWSCEEALERANEVGPMKDDAEVREFVRSYVADQREQ